MKKTILTSIAALLSFNAFANENNDSDYGFWTYNGAIGKTSLNSDNARKEGIDEEAMSYGFYGNYHKGQLLTSLGLDFVSYDDNEGFSETVIQQGGWDDGDISRRSSDASAFLLSAAFGPKFYLGEQQSTFAYLQGGYGLLTYSERSIGSCSNCSSEDIDIEGGVFANGGIKTNLGAISVGVDYRQYLSGDGLENAFSLTIGSAF